LIKPEDFDKTMITDIKNGKIITKVKDFELDAILDCGQSFRWEKQLDGSWQGVAFAKPLSISQQGDSLIFENTTAEDFEEIWSDYFDLNRDYGVIKKLLSIDPVLEKSIGFAPGIRILNQEPWEALCSFIISQNNNIPRIKGIISRLCAAFGDKISDDIYSFPSADRVAVLNEADLAPLRSGFRAGYILDAAKKVSSHEINLASLKTIPIDEARAELKKIKGVGPKVADCALLFGCARLDCFPIDVWIKRVLACFYPEGFPQSLMPYGGIAQQYLFHYARCCPECSLT
jgi:N-glycosylase/DNA lyase